MIKGSGSVARTNGSGSEIRCPVIHYHSLRLVGDAVLRVRDIFVRIRIRGSVPLTYFVGHFALLVPDPAPLTCFKLTNSAADFKHQYIR
jgi:hypothetical protein